MATNTGLAALFDPSYQTGDPELDALFGLTGQPVEELPPLKYPERGEITGGERPLPRGQKVTGLTARAAPHAQTYVEAGARWGVDPSLIMAMHAQESKFVPGQVSERGAMGIGQFMPGTWERYGKGRDPNDYEAAADATAHYMHDLLKMFGGDEDLAIAAYNAGEGNVQKAGNRIPQNNETPNYVKKVKEYRPTFSNFLSGAPQEEYAEPQATPTQFTRSADFQPHIVGAGVSKHPISQADPRLQEILTIAAQNTPYDVQFKSGYRPGDKRQHGKHNAIDVQLVDKRTGKALADYQDPRHFRDYEQFAQTAKAVQEQLYPELGDAFRWGGYFSGKKNYGALDLMHFDIGGGKGLGMLGGSWEGGLNEKQRALWQGVQSQGMGQRAAPDLIVSQTPQALQKTQQESPYYPVRLSDGQVFDVEKGMGLDEVAAMLQQNNINAKPLRPYVTPDGQEFDVEYDMTDDEIQNMLKGQKPVTPEASNYLGAGKYGAQQAISGIAQGAGTEIGELGKAAESASWLGEYGKPVGEFLRGKGEQLHTYGEQLEKEAAAEYTRPKGLNPLEENILYPAVETAGQMLPYVGAGALSAIPGVGEVVGPAAVAGLTHAGVMGGGEQEAKAAGKEFVPSEYRPYAVGADIANIAGFQLFNKALKVFGQEAILGSREAIKTAVEKGGIEAAKKEVGSRLANIAAQTGWAEAGLIGGEVIEDAINRAYLGKPLLDEGAREQYKETAKQVGPLGLFTGPMAGLGTRYNKQVEVARLEEQAGVEQALQEQEAQRQKMEELATIGVTPEQLQKYGLRNKLEGLSDEELLEAFKADLAEKEAAKAARLAELPEELRDIPYREAKRYQQMLEEQEAGITDEETIEPAEEPVPPAEPAGVAPPVTPEISTEAVQETPEVKGELPPVEVTPEIKEEVKLPTHFSDTLGIASKSGKKTDIPLKKALEQLDIENPAHQPTIAQALGEGIKLAEKGQIQLDVPKAQEIINFIKPVEVPRADSIQIPTTPDAGSIAQPEIRQEGQGAPVSSEGVRSGRQEIGAVKIPEIQKVETVEAPKLEIPKAPKIPQVETALPAVTQKAPEVPTAPKKGKAPVSVEKLQTPAEAWESLRTPDQPAFESLSKNTQDLWKKEYKANEGIVSKDAVADYVKAEQPERLLAKGEAPKEIEVEGVKRPTTDSTGASIHTTEEGVKNFWKGFKNTKVVDEKGRPIKLFHSTGALPFQLNDLGFSEFLTDTSEMGAHFGPIQQANEFLYTSPNKEHRRTMPVYLNINNPLRLIDQGKFEIGNTAKQLYEKGVLSQSAYDKVLDMPRHDTRKRIRFLHEQLRDAGYDGIVYLNRREGLSSTWPDGVRASDLDRMSDKEFKELFPEAQDSWIAIAPEQIKSTISNKGEFDVSKPDIRESKGEPAVANPHTKETIQSELKKLYGENAPQIEVSDRATENVDAATKGFFEPSTGRAVLVADNIGKGENLHGLLRHEVAVHAKKLGKSDKEFQDILKQVDNLKEQGAKDVAEAFDRVPEDTKPADRTHEALAYLVQNKPNLPIVKRFMSWLRRTANKITGNAKWLKGDDFAVMADAVLKKAAKEAKTEMKVGKPEERQYAKAEGPTEAELKEAEKRLKASGLVGAVKDKTFGDKFKGVINDLFKEGRNTSFVAEYVDIREPISKAVQDLPDNVGKKLRSDYIYSAYEQRGNVIQESYRKGFVAMGRDGTIETVADKQLALAEIFKRVGAKNHNLFNNVLVALRVRTIRAQDAETRAQANKMLNMADEMEDFASSLKDTAKRKKFNSAARNLRTVAERKLESINWEKGRTAFTEQEVKDAETVLAGHPELVNEAENVYALLRKQVDLLENEGMIDKATADDWRKYPNYFPLYKTEKYDEQLANPSAHLDSYGAMMGKNPDKLPKVHRQEWHEHKVFVEDNLLRHITFFASAAAEHSARKNTAYNLEMVGKAERVKKDSWSDKDLIVKFRENGKDVFYRVDDVPSYYAMQSAMPLMSPLLKRMRQAGNFGRGVMIKNPLFLFRQAIREPLQASLVGRAGFISPFDTLNAVSRIASGSAKGYERLRAKGVIGPVDVIPDPAEFIKSVQNGKGLVAKGMDGINHIHESMDAATRVVVYEKAKKDALSKGYDEETADAIGVRKAREIINFAKQGRSKTVRAIRATTPFFGAALNSLDVMARAAFPRKVGHLSKAEAMEARRNFYSTAFMLATFTTAYAAMMSEDEDYLKEPDRVGNWLIPIGGGKFIKIPIPFEAGWFTKELPELAMLLNMGAINVKEAITEGKKGFAANVLPPVPTAYVLQPIMEVAVDHDFFTGSSIEGKDSDVMVRDRNSKASKLMTEVVNKMEDMGVNVLGVSANQLEHLARKYLGQLWAVTRVASDAYMNRGKVTPEKEAGEYPLVSGVVTTGTKDRAVNEFYTVAKEVSQVNQSLQEAGKKGDAERFNQIVKNPENVKALQGSDEMKKLKEEIGELSTGIKRIEHDQTLSAPEMTSRIKALKARQTLLAKRGVEVARKLGLDI